MRRKGVTIPIETVSTLVKMLVIFAVLLLGCRMIMSFVRIVNAHHVFYSLLLSVSIFLCSSIINLTKSLTSDSLPFSR